MRSIGCIYERDNNAFDFLRFLFASLVILSHSYVLLLGVNNSGDILARLTHGQIDFAAVSVCGFFVISGFLITQSLVSSSSGLNYLLKRVLRIMPALFVSLFFSSFILGPFLTQMDLASYLFNGNTPTLFFFKNLTFNLPGYAWGIQDLFKDNPYAIGVNGSTWTLKHEFAMYLFIPLLLYIFKNNRIIIIASFSMLILTGLNLKYNLLLFNLIGERYWILNSVEYGSFVRLGYYFLAGSTIFLFKDKIRYEKLIIGILLVVLITSVYFNFLKYALLLTLPYLLISLGVVWKFKSFRKYGDFSYGLYIYAFPLQQTLVYFFKTKFNLISFYFTSFILTLIFAIISWHYIEKPALNLKSLLEQPILPKKQQQAA